MSDYTAVEPPHNLSSGFDPSSAFADALQRARQIAAKINTPTSDGTGGGTKRPHEDSQGMDWIEKNPPKKMAALNDPIGAQLAAMQQQRLGGNSNAVITEEFHVPDKMVGLIIGRGGEQITRLQADSSCKIQMAADSGGLPDRSCSLTGTRQAVEKAKEMIMDIVSRGTARPLDAGPLPDGLTVVEMMIPASKVGLIIGKGGETIKNLQERAGVKMVMIQDSQFGNMGEKPLQIKGDPQKAEYARQLVLDLLTERELEVSANMGRGYNRNQNQTNDYGSSQSGTQEVPVPRQAVGVVIGKGGEMIKKIQQDTGARVQFQQDDGPGERERMCFLTGSSEQIQNAQSIIHELINSVLTRDQQNMGRGRGRGRGGFDESRGGGGGGGRGGGGGGPGRGGDFGGGPMGHGNSGPGNRGNQDWMEVPYNVPAVKCGIIIGKGGETIKSINQVTGAHVELSRNQPPNPAEKCFVIRGLPNQIDHAKQLINEKIGGGLSNSGTPPMTNYGMPSGGSGPPQGAPGYPMSGQQPPSSGSGYAPQGWGGAYQQWPAQPAGGGTNDMSKQAVDANAAAWAAYYAQYYGQVQPNSQSAGAPPTQAQPPVAAGAAQSGGAPQAAQSSQPDYSAAWADYYRSMGMYREAEMVEQQARAAQQNPGQQPASQPGAGASAPTASTQPQTPVQPAPTPSTNNQPQQPYSQYSQYGQYGQQPASYPYNNYPAYPQPQ